MTVGVTVAAFAGVAAWMVMWPSVIAPRYILATLLLFVPILAIAAEDVLTTMNVPRMLQMGTTAAVMLAIAASFYVGPSPSINDKSWPVWREQWLQSRERLQDALARPTVRKILEGT